MLDLSDATEISTIWDDLESKAALPTSVERFFSKSGQKTMSELRSFDRHYLRCQAILQCEGESHAIYMKDCSRAGMGLVSPVQLFPRERIEIWMHGQRSYSLEVIRCRRIRTNSYECGTIFVLQ